MRPSSQRSSSQNKPQFQTKMKSRIRGHSVNQNELTNSQFNTTNKSRKINLNRSAISQKWCALDEDKFYQTANKLSNINFSHLNQQMQDQISKQCTCGRHLAKFHIIKPDMTKKTVYQKSFYQQRAIPNLVNHSKEYDKLQGPHLDLNSTYLQGFTGRNGDDIERPHPQDLLHNSGPCPNLTSYSSQFPGHKGDNQYVKPTDKHAIQYFPLRSRSTYTKQYKKKQPKKDDYTYFPDQLKTGYDWYGKTTYGGFFSQPNPQYFAKKVKIIQKKEQNPDYSRQYQTTYKNDFIKKGAAVCPAKIFLQSKGRGQFSDTKQKFAQNTDFKAVSPNFQAISTSKHSYV